MPIGADGFEDQWLTCFAHGPPDGHTNEGCTNVRCHIASFLFAVFVDRFIQYVPIGELRRDQGVVLPREGHGGGSELPLQLLPGLLYLSVLNAVTMVW